VPILEDRDEKVSFHAPIENEIILTKLTILSVDLPFLLRYDSEKVSPAGPLAAA
jgi:hypothetical protein